ncbi:hypothetical protein EON65_06610 [archaeon]|nr:MAG: hypothetical protein EON65_06610 [archaeon]
MQIVALISCSASVLVVLTLVLFRDMRHKIFMRIIAYISIADFFGNFSYVFLNRPDNHSISCQFQGFCNTYFYPVSWVWTTILMYFLYSLASTGKLPLSERTSHLIGWGLPFVLAVIVLTTNSYSRFIDDDNTEVCTLGPDNLSAFIWRLVLYYCFFALCVLVMLVWYYQIDVLQRRGTSAVSARTLNFARNSLQLYPLAMSVCWFPEFVGFFLQFIAANDDYYDFTMNLRVCNGTLTALIFFWKSPTAREYWFNLLTRGETSEYMCYLSTLAHAVSCSLL